MATVALRGKLFGTGIMEIGIYPRMWIKSDTGLSPDLVRTKSGGTYINCTRGGNLTVNLSNPAVDTDDYSEFEIEWSDDGATWYAAPMAHSYVWHSLGLTNIAMSAIKNTLGESTFSLIELCSSPNVNPYAEFHPNGSSPYRMGDFRRYAHGTLGGLYLFVTSGDLTIQGTPIGGTVATGILSCVSCALFEPLIGTSFQYCKVWIELDGASIIDEIYDLRNVDDNFPKLESAALTYQVISGGDTLPVHFHFAMSLNGITWIDSPVGQIEIGSIYYQLPEYDCSIDNWTETGGVNKVVHADISLYNRSCGAATVFEYQTITKYINGADPEETDISGWSALTTKSNGETYTAVAQIFGGILNTYTHYEITVQIRKVSGTEYDIGYYHAR